MMMESQPAYLSSGPQCPPMCPDAGRITKLKALSVAGLLGEAISRIHTGQSVGALFEQQ